MTLDMKRNELKQVLGALRIMPTDARRLHIRVETLKTLHDAADGLWMGWLVKRAWMDICYALERIEEAV